jgi:hypothetical protein
MGGGIGSYYNSALNLSNVTISGNTAITRGGGIENLNALTLVNSTISNNTAGSIGGGIYNWGPSRVINGTLVNNTDAVSNSDIYNVNSLITSALVYNSIIKSCSTGGSGTKPLIDNGGNLDGGTGCGFVNASSMSNATLDLGALANNGGPIPTMMPGANSDAIGFGLPDVCRSAPVNSRDQRGYVRPAASCTSGAVDPNGAANDSIFYDGFALGGW